MENLGDCHLDCPIGAQLQVMDFFWTHFQIQNGTDTVTISWGWNKELSYNRASRLCTVYRDTTGLRPASFWDLFSGDGVGGEEEGEGSDLNCAQGATQAGGGYMQCGRVFIWAGLAAAGLWQEVTQFLLKL